MQEHFEQADHARLVDLDAGIAHGADGDRQGDALQQREVGVNVEPLRLEAGEAASDGLEGLAHGVEMVQAFLETKVGEVVGTQFIAQERRELLVLLEEGVLEVSPVDMMAVLDTIDHARELAAVATMQAGAEYRGYFVGGQSPQAKLTASLEQLVIGELRLKMKLRQYSIWVMA